MSDERTVLEGDLSDASFQMLLIKALLGHADPNHANAMDDIASHVYDLNTDLIITLRNIAEYPNPENDNENASAMRAKAESVFGDRSAPKPVRIKISKDELDAITVDVVLDPEKRQPPPE